MVEVKRRSFPGCQSPAIIPLLAAAATAVAGVSCGSGVSTEEFEGVHKGFKPREPTLSGVLIFFPLPRAGGPTVSNRHRAEPVPRMVAASPCRT